MLVVFTSDNDANPELIEKLGSTGGLHGHKRMLYEGDTRVPFILRWPGKIFLEQANNLLTSFVDFLPTETALSGAPVPTGIDGISLLQTLRGEEQKDRHESPYFEIYEPHFKQTVHWGTARAPDSGFNLRSNFII